MKHSIQYEDFGAKGDGVTDDMEAICAAHAYANTHRLQVISKPDAEYYIGARALTAIIETDTNWSTSRFIIDDRNVENNKLPCFEVRSTLKPFSLPLRELSRDQSKLDFIPEQSCYVKVVDANKKNYIRYGLNQNGGFDQTDCFILEKDGRISSPIDWNYNRITEAVAWPIDEQTLTIRGGIFTTIANQAEAVYNYYARGIRITRSNTRVDGISHYVVGEGPQGSPYAGFLSVSRCANITIENCFVTGHKIYTTIGAANLPVQMGSYDLEANSAINLTFRGCRMNHITDRTRWGVINSNFCKNIIVVDCTLSRLDAHMGVSGTLTIRNSNLGWQSVNAIGRGDLVMDRVTLTASRFLNLREDYGSTWEGRLSITDCTWIVSNDGQERSYVVRMRNRGQHDFGYPCYMPEVIEISNLTIDDSALPDDHELFLFEDPSAVGLDGSGEAVENPPYPHILCKSVNAQNISVASGKNVQISTNEKLFQQAIR